MAQLLAAALAGAALWYPLRVFADMPLAGPIGILIDSLVPVMLGAFGAAIGYVAARTNAEGVETPASIALTGTVVLIVATGGLTGSLALLREHFSLTAMRADAVGRAVAWLLLSPIAAVGTAVGTFHAIELCSGCRRVLKRDSFRTLLYDGRDAEWVAAAVQAGEFSECHRRAKQRIGRVAHDAEVWDGVALEVRRCASCGSASAILSARREATAAPVFIGARALDADGARILMATAEEDAALAAALAALPPADLAWVGWLIRLVFLAIVVGLVYLFRDLFSGFVSFRE